MLIFVVTTPTHTHTYTPNPSSSDVITPPVAASARRVHIKAVSHIFNEHDISATSQRLIKAALEAVSATLHYIHRRILQICSLVYVTHNT